MKTSRIALALAVAAGAVLALPASAQTTTSSSTSAASGTGGMWRPYSTNGYIGFNAGRSDYDVSCGTGGQACDDTDRAWKLYTGSMMNPYFGAELGLINFGEIDRAGGSTRASGLNLSLVGRAPIGNMFSVFGKVGTTYSRGRTSAAAGTGVRTGSDNGFGLSYGLGASVDFTQNWSLVLEWERHDVRFAGGRDPVKTTTLGVKYGF
ncbi:MAG: outer membrane beta-barrel protein [Burkholderiaceae bacterium]